MRLNTFPERLGGEIPGEGTKEGGNAVGGKDERSFGSTQGQNSVKQLLAGPNRSGNSTTNPISNRLLEREAGL